MKYQIKYDSVYKGGREWLTLNHEFEANSDSDAIKYAKKFVKNKNKEVKGRPEEYELIGIERIEMEIKTTPLSVSK